MSTREKDIRISICIPQYNRVDFLIENLEQIGRQTYPHIEISISDDCSTDNTEQTIKEFIPDYKYPVLYERFETNQGYDRNLRRAMEMSTGDYIFILGNDDTINPEYAIEDLVSFLEENNLPDIGFTNFISANTNQINTRAHVTGMLGQGPDTAIAYYSCFSFIGGMILKRERFLEFNTSSYDKSIYGQMYFSTIIISSGGRLFSIKDPVVIKDILPDHEANRVSYLDHIPKRWKDYKILDGGLHSVIFVVLSGFVGSKTINQRIMYKVFRKIYTTTFPFWIVNYRRNGALPAAVGLIMGLKPWKAKFFNQLSLPNRFRISIRYFFSIVGGLLIPFGIYDFIVKHFLKKSVSTE